MTLNKCECGKNKFFVIAEKVYEGRIDEKGVLVCEPEWEEIIEINCIQCRRIYKIKNFDEIEY